MIPRPRLVAASTLLLSASLTMPLSALAAPSTTGLTARNVAVCPTPQNVDSARCHAILHELVTPDGKPAPQATAGPSGYHPADLQSAYGLAALPAGTGAGRTVAIVDAYDHPYAASDLATYRSTFGLPSMSTCTVTSTSVTSPGGPCFAKVNQNGVAGSYPTTNGGWAQEESLDIDMVSAICPNCNIVLVEAASASFGNLGTAVNTAARFGAVAISNSYGSSGDLNDATYGSYYNHPGIAVTASTGDNGYGVGYPATSDYVVAVGGTSLKNTSGTWSESAWSGAGSGCSTYQAKPSFQSAISYCNAMRGIADVSAVADPNTGVAVYDSYAYQGYSGWMVFGGTSASAPIIAAVYALAGATHSGATVSYPAAMPYTAASGVTDVVGGTNGTCSTAALCSAVSGWDGPTGLGSPYGLAAFGGSTSGGGTTIPAAPTGLTATAGNGSVSLSWSASSGATSYSVYRSTSSGTESSLVSGLASTSYNDTAVTNGTTYYYEVSATNSAGTSGLSAEASATPTAPTGASMSVPSVSYALTTKGSKALQITMTVVDGAGHGVSGATVSITVNKDGVGYASGSATTGSTGSVTFRVNHPASGYYTTHVDNVTASGYQWDGRQPTDPGQQV